MTRSSSIIDTLGRWMLAAADSGKPITAEEVRNWCRALKSAHADLVARELAIATATDGMTMLPTDRFNAAEAEAMHYGLTKLVHILAEHAGQAATRKELVEIDKAASAIIDISENLTLGVARPVQSQPQTGA